MESNEIKKVPEVQSDTPSNVNENVSISNGTSLDDLKSLIKTSVAELLKDYQPQIREELQDYNTKIAQAVNKSQSTLIRPKLNNEQPIAYVKRVLEEDSRRRLQDSQGKNRYNENNVEEFTKAKIVILKQIGLTEEEIAEEMKDII